MDNSSLSRGRLRISLNQNSTYNKFLTRPRRLIHLKSGTRRHIFEVFLAIWRRVPKRKSINHGKIKISCWFFISHSSARLCIELHWKNCYMANIELQTKGCMSKNGTRRHMTPDSILKSPKKSSNIDLAKMEHKTISMQCLALNLFI